jgi:hypothetical protein
MGEVCTLRGQRGCDSCLQDHRETYGLHIVKSCYRVSRRLTFKGGQRVARFRGKGVTKHASLKSTLLKVKCDTCFNLPCPAKTDATI